MIENLSIERRPRMNNITLAMIFMLLLPPVARERIMFLLASGCCGSYPRGFCRISIESFCILRVRDGLSDDFKCRMHACTLSHTCFVFAIGRDRSVFRSCLSARGRPCRRGAARHLDDVPGHVSREISSDIYAKVPTDVCCWMDPRSGAGGSGFFLANRRNSWESPCGIVTPMAFEPPSNFLRRSCGSESPSAAPILAGHPETQSRIKLPLARPYMYPLLLLSLFLPLSPSLFRNLLEITYMHAEMFVHCSSGVFRKSFLWRVSSFDVL